MRFSLFQSFVCTILFVCSRTNTIDGLSESFGHPESSSNSEMSRIGYEKEQTVRKTSIVRKRWGPLRRPSKDKINQIPFEPDRLHRDRESSEEEKEKRGTTITYEFVIAGNYSSFDLLNCCKSQIQEGVYKTVLELYGLELDDTKTSHFVTISDKRECTSSPHYFVQVNVISFIAFPDGASIVTKSFISNQIKNAIENGELEDNILRTGLSSKQIGTISIDGGKPLHLLCDADSVPSVMPTVTTSLSPSANPVKAPISLLFQVGLASGKTAHELSECCRDQILDGARLSMNRILSGLGGRRSLLQSITKNTEVETQQKIFRWLTSSGENATATSPKLQSISIVSMVDADGIVDVEFDIQIQTQEVIDDAIILETIEEGLTEEVKSGRFTEDLKKQGLTEIKVTLSSNVPSTSPSFHPTTSPSSSPTTLPSRIPSILPSSDPSSNPTNFPSGFPSMKPTNEPSFYPSSSPSSDPSDEPSSLPSASPSSPPSNIPSNIPSFLPSSDPSSIPTSVPSSSPSSIPSDEPSVLPSFLPSFSPSNTPSIIPSSFPSSNPSSSPTLIYHQYVGCYNDKPDPERALPYLVGKDKNIEECQTACAEKGFRYSALQWLGECRCGNSDYNKYGKNDLCECYSKNVGSFVNCVYEKKSSSSCKTNKFTSEYVGCYNDKEENRVMQYSIGNNMNTTQCLEACREQGFTFFGIQWLGECRCGFGNYAKYGKSDLCICDAPNVGAYVNCIYEVIQPCSSASGNMGRS